MTSTLSERARRPACRGASRWWILAVLCFSLLVIVLDNTILNVAIPTLVARARRRRTASSSGWSTPTRSCSPGCCSPPAASVTASVGAARCRSASSSSASARCASAFADHRRTSSSPPGRSWASAARSSCRRPCRSSPTSSRPSERGKAIGVWAGDRRPRRRARPAHRRLPARALLVGLGLPREHPDRRRRPASPASSSSRRRRTRRAAELDPVGAVLSIVGLTALLYGDHRGAAATGWTDPMILVVLRRRRRAARRVRWSGSAHRPPDARRALLQEPPLHRRQRRRSRWCSSPCSARSFLLTQYLQFVLGYTPLEAGIRMLPVRASCMMVVSPLERAVRRAVRHQGRRRHRPAHGHRRARVDGRRSSVDSPLRPDIVWRHGAHGHRHGPRHGPGHRVDHGLAAAGQGRRRLGGQRHHPPGRRRARRRHHRQRPLVDLRLPGR